MRCDFTSALYLGMHHPTAALEPWQTLTYGRPAVLQTAHPVAHDLAKLMGCARGALLPSTLHAFWDLFTMLGDNHTVIYLDGGSYPIIRWGVERAAGRGAGVKLFPHHNARYLAKQLTRDLAGNLRPIVVADGFCPVCGRFAPLNAYLEALRACGGCLVIDDTQALGIWGMPAKKASPYGRGGGGTLARCGLEGKDIIVVNSLAKSFGVPVAVLGAAEPFVQRFLQLSQTRHHCSPPATAVIHAAANALQINRRQGEALRTRLASNVRRFRMGLAELGITVGGGLFPVQTIFPGDVCRTWDAFKIYERLMQKGVQTLMHPARNGGRPYMSFIITARHTFDRIDYATKALNYAVNGRALRRSKPLCTLGGPAQLQRSAGDP